MPNNATKKKKSTNRRTNKTNRSKRGKPNSLSNPVTTINGVSNRLLRNSPSKSRNGCGSSGILSPYIHCRLNPFHSVGSPGIPDGTSVRRVIFDHRSRSVVQCNGTGLLDIQFIPGLPCGALYRSFSTSTTPQWIVDGNNIIDPNIVTGSAVATQGGAIGWVQGNFYPEWLALALQAPNTNNADSSPIPSSRARVVSVGWKISYIGQPMQASGYYYATRTPVDLVGSNVLNPDPLLVYATGATIVQTTYAVDNAWCQVMNATQPAGAATQMQTSDRIDVGATGVLRANAQPDWKIMPRQNWFPVQQTSSGNTQLSGMIDSIPGVSYGSMRFWDDRFDPTTVRIQGMTSGTTLLVETVACVEYEVDVNNILSRIAEPAVINKPQLLNDTEKLLAGMPISEKLIDIDKPYNTALRTMGNAARQATKFAKLVPGPVGIAANTVDSLIDLFGNM